MHFNATDSIIREMFQRKQRKKNTHLFTHSLSRSHAASSFFPFWPSASELAMWIEYISRSCVIATADSRSLTGLILRRVMKKRFLSHLFPSLDSFIIFLFFVYFFCMRAVASTLLLRCFFAKFGVWNKNYIFYVDVSLQCMYAVTHSLCELLRELEWQ